MINTKVIKHILTHYHKDQMIIRVKKLPDYISGLLHLALSTEPLYAWRAAWLLFDCIDEQNKEVAKNINKIIKHLPNCEDGHKRELLKLVYLFPLKKTYEGKLFDLCVQLWEDPKNSGSLRYYAFKVLLKFSQKYPDLKPEILLMCEDRFLDSLSKGVKHSILKMIKEGL